MCHPYGITKAPDGSFYITDAAANALLHRTKMGCTLLLRDSWRCESPACRSPVTESVPTGGIMVDGKEGESIVDMKLIAAQPSANPE